MTEYGLIATIWIIYALVLLILPLLVLCFVGHRRQQRKTAVWSSLSVLGIEIVVTVFLCVQPLMVNLTEQALDTETENIIRYVSDGRYNDVLPVFPTAVVVIENEDGFLRWKTYYGFWGKTEHIYADTYEMTEPLWRW